MEFPTGFSEQMVTANGIQVRIVTGTDSHKPSLLLLHGIYDRAESWLPVVEGLARDFYLVMPDLRGHYRSDWPVQGYELTDYATDAVALLDALGIDKTLVLGHSLGGLITIVLTGQEPERFRAAVLEDPPSERSRDIRTWVGALLTAKHATEEQTYVAVQAFHPGRTEDDWHRETEWLRATADGPFLALESQMLGEPELFDAVMARISCPILLLQADPRLGGALSTEAARRVTAGHEDRQLVTFPDAGHLIHREHPEKFVEVVAGFLREI